MRWLAQVLAGMAMMISVFGAGCGGGRLPLLYIGKYNEQGGAGLQAVRWDAGKGEFHLAAEGDAGINPSFFCISARRGLIHAINEVDDFGGEKAGGITTLAIDAASGALRKVSELAVPDGGPCYIAFSRAEDYLLVANYGGGSVAVVRLDARGLPEAVTDFHKFDGGEGRTARAHMIAPGSAGDRILVTDLGLDRVTRYDLDRSAGVLRPVAQGEAALPKGAGPRHFAFSREGACLYVINERNSTITLFSSSSDALEEIQTVSTLPEGFSGINYCADLHLGRDGRFLYGTNRGHNSIVTFSIAPDGRLTLAGHTPCGGDWPRNFVIDPSGRYLVVANQRSDSAVLFEIDQRSGLPVPLQQEFRTTAPACLKFAQ